MTFFVETSVFLRFVFFAVILLTKSVFWFLKQVFWPDAADLSTFQFPQHIWTLTAFVCISCCSTLSDSISKVSSLSLFSSWNAVFCVCTLWKYFFLRSKPKKKKKTQEPLDDRHHVKMAKKQKCHQKAHSALLLMETRLLTSFLLQSFHIIQREKGQETADKRTQMQRLHFSLEDVKISVLKKKIKGPTLNGEWCLKCRHCSALEKRDVRWELLATDFGVTSKSWL